MADLVLASTSPYRRALLGRLGVPFRWRAPLVDEEEWKAAGLDPRTLAERLATAIHDVLTRAIAAGGSSLRDYVQTSGELGYFQHHWAVYGKEGERCPGCDCKTGIRRMVQSGRSTFYCAKRQK